MLHFATVGNESGPRGRIGDKSFRTSYGDAGTLIVELSESACFYVIGFNFNGSEQLLWPADEKGQPQATLSPPQLSRLRFPAG